MPSRRAFIIGASAAAGALLLPRGAASATAPTGLTTAAAPAAPAALSPAALERSRAMLAADQTPIDIRTRQVVTTPGQPLLRFHYPAEVDVEVRYVNKDGGAGCGIRDHEETVEAEVPAGAAWVTYGGVRYELLQFHFHIASEHRVNGHAFPMEQHFVHRAADGSLLVVGAFLRGGGHRTVVDRVLHTLPAECGGHLHVGHVDLRAALPRDLHTYRYLGSLTTVPFTPGVRWHVLRTPLHVEWDTIARFHGLFPHGNSRPLQPTGDRVVRLGPGQLVR